MQGACRELISVLKSNGAPGLHHFRGWPFNCCPYIFSHFFTRVVAESSRWTKKSIAYKIFEVYIHVLFLTGLPGYGTGTNA